MYNIRLPTKRYCVGYKVIGTDNISEYYQYYWKEGVNTAKSDFMGMNAQGFHVFRHYKDAVTYKRHIWEHYSSRRTKIIKVTFNPSKVECEGDTKIGYWNENHRLVINYLPTLLVSEVRVKSLKKSVITVNFVTADKDGISYQISCPHCDSQTRFFKVPESRMVRCIGCRNCLHVI